MLPKEVLDGRLGGPGLVLMDPPYEPYNEYLTWNLHTIHMLLGLGSGSLLGSLGFNFELVKSVKITSSNQKLAAELSQ